MKVARLWSEVVDDRPRLDSTLSRSSDRRLNQQILEYLKAGVPVLRSPTLLDDQLDPVRRACVPSVFLTDGTWIWSGEHTYYLEQHGVLPEADFRATMQQNDFRVPPVDEAALSEAQHLLLS